MKKFKKYLLVTLLLLSFSVPCVVAQDDETWESVMMEEVEVENPVYRPVLGVSLGILNFAGDIKNDFGSLTSGRMAFRINLSTFLDKMHFYKVNFYYLNGELYGKDNARNLNFQSTVNSYGINLHYEFDHFRIHEKKITPFVSLGFEALQFSPKSDLLGGNGLPYNYWTDGTVRTTPQFTPGDGKLMNLDDKYESDLRELTGQSYGQMALALPIELGMEFVIGKRVSFRVATSYHYTFSDNIDNLGSTPVKITDNNNAAYQTWNGLKGKSGNDAFFYTYFSVHFDLWSDSKTMMIENLFKDVDNVDYDLFSDEDNDGVFDNADDCLGTPVGVPVDSLGCPLDGDDDGVPDYMDKQFDTPAGAIVDEKGVEMNPNDLARLLDNSNAVSRKDAYMIGISGGWSKYGMGSKVTIPEKFKTVDKDGDGYISFGELLDVIDGFFDGSGSFTTADIYELNDFFFKQ